MSEEEIYKGIEKGFTPDYDFDIEWKPVWKDEVYNFILKKRYIHMVIGITIFFNVSEKGNNFLKSYERNKILNRLLKKM